jgi:hypothetical protein
MFIKQKNSIFNKRKLYFQNRNFRYTKPLVNSGLKIVKYENKGIS